jgi:hypothetical protein
LIEAEEDDPISEKDDEKDKAFDETDAEENNN